MLEFLRQPLAVKAALTFLISLTRFEMLNLQCFRTSEKIPDFENTWPSGTPRTLLVLSLSPFEHWACAHTWCGFIDEETGENKVWAELNHSSSQDRSDIIAWALLPEEFSVRYDAKIFD